MKWNLNIAGAAVGGLILMAALWGCGSEPERAASGKPVVFVSIVPQATFVEKLAGDLVDVRVMVGPGQSPATYEPSPKQMTALAEAKLYFRIGVPFESVWIERLRKINPDMRIVDTRAGSELRSMVAHSHEHDEPGHAPHEDGEPRRDEDRAGIKDPHIWLDPNLVKIQAKTMCAALVAEFPEAEATLTENLESFTAELTELDRYIQARLAGLNRRTFLVFHPSWGYFAEAYSLEQVTVEIEGKEPGGQALVRIIETAQEHDIKTVFVQKQFSAKTAETIARAIGGAVVPLDPLSGNYIENLRQVADTLARELGK